MNSRIPLISAVVGALLVGGATTGATHASWTSQRHLQAHQVSAGSMSFTATSPGAVTVDKVSGSTAETSFVLDDTSAGKNLQQRITTTVGSSPAGVTTTVGTSCSTTGASAVVDTTPTSANQTVCVKVTSSPTAVSGTVTLHISGAQRPTGWSTPVLTRTFAVTVNSAFSLGCPTVGTTRNLMPLTWTTASGATAYSVREDTVVNGAFTNQVFSDSTAPLDTAHTVTMTAAGSRYYLVRATTAGGTVLTNKVLVTRAGNNGQSNMSCEVVTP
jgi:hypothetical protein